jgi:hypothetical protein
VHDIADGPQYRLHKGLDVARKLQVGSTLPAGPGAACTASVTIWPAQATVNVAGRGTIPAEKIPAAQQAAGIFIARIFDQ